MKKIAIIDDSTEYRSIVRTILDGKYEISEYETGSSGLDGIRKIIPNLLLLDINLPEMDGREVLKILRLNKITEKLPVIAFTTHAKEGDKERFLSLGFNAYISKPLSNDSILLDSIEGLLKE